MPEPVAATYQGIVCLSADAQRTPGIETDAYSVVIGWDGDAGDPTVSPPTGDLFPELGRRGQVVADLVGKRLASELLPFGDLVMADPNVPGRAGLTVLQDLYIRDDGLRYLSMDERQSLGIRGAQAPEHVLQLDLVDIRYFLLGRGCLHGDFNVIDRGRGTFYTQSEDKGQPYTLRNFILALLALLPGRLPLARWPTFSEGVPIEDVVARFDAPGQRLADAIERYGLVPGLTAENAFTLDEVGDGREGHGAENQEDFPEDLVRSFVPLNGVSYVADHIIVGGPPSQHTIRVPDLEPVGVSIDGETILPMDDALETYGLKRTDVEIITLYPSSWALAFLTVQKGLSIRAAQQVMSFAGMMFRIPNVDSSSSHVVPMLDRVEVDEGTGERLPILVEARSVDDVAVGRKQAESGSAPSSDEFDEAVELQMANRALAGGNVIAREKQGTGSSALASFARDLTKRRGGRLVHLGEPIVSDRQTFVDRADYLLKTEKKRALSELIINVGGDQQKLIIAVTKNVGIAAGDRGKADSSAFSAHTLSGAKGNASDPGSSTPPPAFENIQKEREARDQGGGPGLSEFIPDFLLPQQFVARKIAEAATSSGDDGIEKGEEVLPAKSDGEKAKKTTGPLPLAAVNVARGRIDPADYTIDRDRGIITFRRPMGWLEAPSGALQSQRLDISKAGVCVTYGVELTANPEVRVPNIKDHWVAAYDLDENGKLKQVEPNVARSNTKVIRDPSLQWFIALDGQSNSVDLEARSMQLAVDYVGRLRAVKTTTRVLGGCFATETNGVVTAVSWRVDASGEASTTVLTGSRGGLGGARGFRQKRVTTSAAGYVSSLDAVDVLHQVPGGAARNAVARARQATRRGS